MPPCYNGGNGGKIVGGKKGAEKVMDLLVTVVGVMVPTFGMAWMINGKLGGMAKEIESLHRENVANVKWRDGMERRLESIESHLRGGGK